MEEDYFYVILMVLIFIILLFFTLNILRYENFANNNDIVVFLPTFYENCFNKNGDEFTLDEGDYTTNDLIKLSDLNPVVISKIVVPIGWKIILYSQDNFQGNVKTMYTSECLLYSKFDIINSIKVRKIPVLYDNCDLKGGAIPLDEGTYTLDILRTNKNSTLVGDFLSSISSVIVPNGFIVTLYSGDNFSGSSIYLTNTVTCLKDPDYNFNKRTISVKVENVPVVYEACNYNGFSLALIKGNYTLSHLKYLMNQKGYSKDITGNIKSVKVPDGMKLTLWENEDLTGKSFKINYNNPCLKGVFVMKSISVESIV